MFKWLKKRNEEKLEKSGGLQEKRKAIEIKNEVSEEVTRKMLSILGERRHEESPFSGPDRRLRTA